FFVRRRTDGKISSISFDIKSNDFTFNPGQYIRLTIPTLKASVLKGNTRDFTISSSPDKKGIIQIAFRNSDSEFKKKILKASTGTKIQAQGPLGVFTLPEDSNTPIVFVAGGMGITPALSIIRFVSSNKTGHNIHIVYANSSMERAAYIKEIRSIAKNNSNIQLTEKIGRIDAEFIKKSVEYTDKTLWYLCGLPEMVFALSKNIPRVLEVTDQNIRIEEYVGYQKNKTNYKVFPSVKSEDIELTDENVMSDKNLISSLLDAIGQGALVAVTDTQGTIQYINKKFIEVAKYSKEELVGQNHRILKSGFHSPEFYEELWKSISSGKRWQGEIKNRAKDGTFYWVDTTITPILDDQKRIKQYIAVRFLISDKKNLEENEKINKSILEDIAAEKEKMSTILEGIGDGVFVVDNDLNIIVYNNTSALLSGFTAKEAIGKPYGEILRFVYEKDGKLNDKFIKEAFRTGKIQEMENHTELIRKNGTKVTVADSATPLKNEIGEVVGVVVVFRDVSEEREVDKAKTEFVSLASHQLRNPLTSISWYAEILLSGDAGKLNKEQEDFINEIYRGNQRMINLVNALLNVSRIDLGTFAIDPKPTNLIEIAESVVHELTPQINRKSLNLESSYEKLPLIDIDVNLTRIIFQNIFSNAVKYTPSNGNISITIKKRDTDVLISVSDTGYGIPKAQQSRVFEKLFRADNIQEKYVEGTGLGLYLVKSVVEMAGGKVWFESEENKGSTFYVTIPLSGMKKKKGAKGLS
ncbi:PAS domain-containing protein, partial [Candidatus Wolfebacteria bacterium]|nr:PAS domain-containing protein [Candidatus Wolfebacteria bacterium]